MVSESTTNVNESGCVPKKRRIGIFGGSFDPIHYGHLILADSCREALSLDEVRLIPAATSPLKPKGPIASNEDRLEMVRLAVGDTPGLAIDPIEMEMGGISYTLDTVRALETREPETQWFLMLGADSVASLDQWKEPAELLRRVQLAVVSRGGHAPPDLEFPKSLMYEQDRPGFAPSLVKMPVLEISSTDIRRRISENRSIRFRTPREVEAWIYQRGLYK